VTGTVADRVTTARTPGIPCPPAAKLVAVGTEGFRDPAAGARIAAEPRCLRGAPALAG